VNRKDRRLWIGIAVLIVLVIFLFPKECGTWTAVPDVTIIKCNCLGYSYESSSYSGDGKYMCIGICLKDRCKTESYSVDVFPDW